jgi:hypothetical protein
MLSGRVAAWSSEADDQLITIITLMQGFRSRHPIIFPLDPPSHNTTILLPMAVVLSHVAVVISRFKKRLQGRTSKNNMRDKVPPYNMVSNSC